MDILVVSFSVNGAMGDNFKLVIKHLRQSENNIRILTNTNTKINPSENVSITEIPFNRSNPLDFINPYSYLKILLEIAKNKFDAVLFLSFHPANLFVTKFISTKKIFMYIHDHENHSGISRFDTFFLKPQYNYIYKKNIHLITSSHFMKNEILRKHKNINASKVHVIYLGLLENLISHHQENIKEDIDVLFFGRIEYYKGLDTWINSYTKFNSNYSGVIIGKGNLDIFGINKLPEKINHINTYISDKDLAEYIMRSRIVIMPYRDATGTQVIQSVFYYGKSIIATNVGCFSEYITNGYDGVIIDKENELQLNDAINLLLENRELREKMGHNAKGKINTIFSNAKINQQYIDLLEANCK